MLRELEVRAAEDDHAQAEAERQARERQRLWELEIERAKERFAEVHRAKILRDQMAAWREARALSSYLSALEEAQGDNLDASDWITWIREHIESLDPLKSPRVMPEAPEPRPDDLKPFLPGGMSPYTSSRR